MTARVKCPHCGSRAVVIGDAHGLVTGSCLSCSRGWADLPSRQTTTDERMALAHYELHHAPREQCPKCRTGCFDPAAQLTFEFE